MLSPGLFSDRGLGVERVFTNFLKLYCDPGNLVLVLNTTPQEEQYFIEQLEASGTKPLPKTITNEYNATDRYSLKSPTPRYTLKIWLFMKLSLHEIFTDFRLQIISLHEIFTDWLHSFSCIFLLQNPFSLNKIFTDWLLQ